MRKSLQQVFAENFGRDDLEGAKRWIRKWAQDDDQIVIGYETECSYTTRAMAGHVSDYLEGFTGEEPKSYNAIGCKPYTATKYGSILYDAAWSSEETN